MKLYLAAVLYNDFRAGSTVYKRLDKREQRAVDENPHILDSYHYIKNPRIIKRIRETGKRIFLDSGAFSAFTQGATININEYCRFVKQNRDLFEVISVLDAIGDADKTYANQKEMERVGIPALPCYHYGEPEDVIDYYATNYEYITIGGMVPISTPQLRIWLDRIWSKYLVNPDGTPKLKVHGFGLTSVPLLVRYPWYSADSSSWVQLGGMGNVFMPQFGTLAISEFAPQRKEAERHFDNLSAEHQTVVREFIESLGFDIARLRTLHLSRKCFNMVTYGMTASYVGDKYVQTQPTLF